MQNKVPELWKCEKNTFCCGSKETQLPVANPFFIANLQKGIIEIGKKRLTIELKENLYAIVLIQPTYTRLACSEEVLKDSDSSFHSLYWPWLTDVLLAMNAIIWGRLVVQPWIKCWFTIEAHSSWIRRYNGMKALSPALHSLSTRLGFIFSDGIRLMHCDWRGVDTLSLILFFKTKLWWEDAGPLDLDL